MAPSLITHGALGLLCEDCHAQSLADACTAFLDLPRERRIALGRAGREKMEREFDQAIVVAAYAEAIRHSAPLPAPSFEGDAA